VNKGKRKGRGSREAPALPLLVPVAYLARTFQVRLAGLWSVLPAASVARTLKVWEPLASPVYRFGEEQALKSAPSREHSKVELGSSVEENVKLASLVFTVPDGPELMTVSGGVVSALPGAPWHASVPAGLVLLGGFSAP
jgi:hypothetical protein